MKAALRVLGIIAACVGIIVASTMIIESNNIEVPKKYVFVSSLSSAYDSDWSDNKGAQYLGGDAYNYIVEASLKAGYYNATVMTKTVKTTGGTILLFASLFFLFFSSYSLQNCLHPQQQVQNTPDKDYQSFVLQHLQRIEDNTRSETGSPESSSPEEPEETPELAPEEYPEEDLEEDPGLAAEKEALAKKIEEASEEETDPT